MHYITHRLHLGASALALIRPAWRIIIACHNISFWNNQSLRKYFMYNGYNSRSQVHRFSRCTFLAAIAIVATQLTAALTTLQSQSASLSSSLSTIQIRSDFTTATINTLQTGADALVAADSNEEGANLLALQTQQSLSTTALSLSAQSDKNVLKLFGG